ncbi:MAG: carboxymuconolactone decarboxylase family protein [Myxococcota bacterium]
MSTYPVQTAQTAPEGSRDLLQGIQKTLGFIPNLYGTMANNPAVLAGYLGLSEAFSKTSFRPQEQQLILLAASTLNGCDYCVAAHSTVAQMVKLDAGLLHSVRNSTPLADARLDALVNFTRTIVAERGWVSEDVIDAFVAAGWDRRQVPEVILGVSLKTFSNYFNHINQTEVDAAFQANAWSRD